MNKEHLYIAAWGNNKIGRDGNSEKYSKGVIWDSYFFGTGLYAVLWWLAVEKYL